MVSDIIAKMPKNVETLIDFGVGDEVAVNSKAKPILESSKSFKRYVPIDTADNNLSNAKQIIEDTLPNLIVSPLKGDFYNDEFDITGSDRYGLLLGATISNQEMNIGDVFPEDQIIEKIKALKSNLKSGAMLMSFDDNKDIVAALESYNHTNWHRMTTGVMYDVQALLSPEGGFHPSLWYYNPHVDKTNNVLHHAISPSVNQSFSIAGHDFNLHKGQRFVISNNIKFSKNLIQDLCGRAGFNISQDAWGSANHSLKMQELEIS